MGSKMTNRPAETTASMLPKGLQYRESYGYKIDKVIYGERIIETLGHISREEAEVKLLQRIKEAKSAEYIPEHITRSLTVRDALNQYWTEKLQHCKSEKTNPSRRYYLTAIDRLMGNKLLIHLKKKDIEEYKRIRASEKVKRSRRVGSSLAIIEHDYVKPRTIQAELSELSMAINHLVDNEVIKVNQVKRFCRYQVPRKKKVVLDHGREFGPEFLAIYRKLSPSWRLFYLTSYATGMRPSELIKLRWEWIEQPFAGYYMVNYPASVEKTEHCDRRIPLAPWLMKRLMRIEHRKGLVFRSAATNEMIVEYRRPWTLARAKAGIGREYTPYCLRRTRATVWDQIDTAAARVALGHVPHDVHEESYVEVTNERLFKLVGVQIETREGFRLYREAV